MPTRCNDGFWHSCMTEVLHAFHVVIDKRMPIFCITAALTITTSLHDIAC